MTYGIRILIKARPYFNQLTVRSLYFSFLHSYLSYGIISWGSTYSTHLTSIQTIQNQAIRIATCSLFRANARSLLHDNNILTIKELIDYNLGIFMYKTITNQLPHLSTSIFMLTNSNTTRFALNNNFILPKVRTNYGKQTFYFSGIAFWNTLPLNIKASRTLNEIKNKLKKHICTMSNT